MQDILLEPYGGQILHLTVGQTTSLTATLAAGGFTGLAVAGWSLGRGVDSYRLAAFGAVAGLAAFSAVIFAAPLSSVALFAIGACLIGFGAGLFAVGTLSASMEVAREGQSGLAIGAWGAVQASAAGIAIALGGVIRDAVSGLAAHGLLGSALADPSIGYATVYHIEIALLFATLVAIGPLVRSTSGQAPVARSALQAAGRSLAFQPPEVTPMPSGAITGYIDVAQLTLYAFWIFFAGLIFYLRREDKREGYPLQSDRSVRIRGAGLPADAAAQDFQVAGAEAPGSAPRVEEAPAAPRARGDRRLAGGAVAAARRPDARWRRPRGLRAARRCARRDDRGIVSDRPAAGRNRLRGGRPDPDPRGMSVVGADGSVAGTVRDLWVDRSEVVIRYLEVEVAAPASAGARHVLLPVNFAQDPPAVADRSEWPRSAPANSPRCPNCATPTGSPCARKTASPPTTPAGIYMRRPARLGPML